MAVLMLAVMSLSAQLEFSHTSIYFAPADTAVNTDTVQLCLKNTGSNPVTVDSTEMQYNNFGTAGLQNVTIAAGDSVVLDFTFNQNQTPGLYHDFMHFYYGGIDSVLAVEARLNWPRELFTMDDVDFWIGHGQDSAVLVIDFNDITPIESYAWGFLFTDSISAADMMDSIQNNDTLLAITGLGFGFINDISYIVQSGIGGNPDWWSTWSGTGIDDWMMNWGISETVYPGSWFGCSYGWSYLDMPGLPAPAAVQIGVEEMTEIVCDVYPNPFAERITVEGAKGSTIQLYDVNGRMITSIENASNNQAVDVTNLNRGMYILKVYTAEGVKTHKLIKQ